MSKDVGGHTTSDFIYFYTVDSNTLTSSTKGSYITTLNLNTKKGFTPFFLSCNFKRATGMNINSVDVSPDKKTVSVVYNVLWDAPREFEISLTYFVIRDSR